MIIDDLRRRFLLEARLPEPPFPDDLPPEIGQGDVLRARWQAWHVELRNVFVPVYVEGTDGYIFPLVAREAKPGEACVFTDFPKATVARNRVAVLAGMEAPFPAPALAWQTAISGNSYELAFLLTALWGRGCFVRARGRDPGVTLVATGALGEATVGPVSHVEEKLAAARARLGERLLFVYCAEREVRAPGADTLSLPPGCPLPEALRRIFAEWSRRVGIPASWRDLYVAANALRRDAAGIFAADGEGLALGNLAAASAGTSIPDDAFAFPLPPFDAPRAQPFVPNGNLLARLDAWVACPPDAKRRDPFVLYGSPGSGRKTSLAECFARNSALFLGRVHHWRLDRDLLEDRTPGALAAAWDDLGADLEAYRPTCVVADLSALGDAEAPPTLIADFAQLCRAYGFRGVLLCDNEPAGDASWWGDDPGVAAGVAARVAPAWPRWGTPADFFRDDGAYDEKANDRYVRALLAGAAPPHWLAACVPQLRFRPAARILALRDRLRAGETLTAEDFVDKPNAKPDVTTLNCENLLVGYLTGDYSLHDLWDWLIALFEGDDLDGNGEALDPLHVRLGRRVFHPLLGLQIHSAFRLVIDFLIPFALWGKVYATRFGDEALDETLGSENFGGFEDFPLRFPDADDRADARLALLPWAIVATNGEACKGTLGFQGAYSRAAKRIVSQEPPPRPDVRDCGTFLQVGAQAMAARRWEANRVRRVRAWVALAFTEGATVDEASAAFARAACAGRPDIELIVQYAMLVLCQCATGTYTPALGEALARWKALLDDTFPSDARVFLPRLRRMHRQAGNLVNRLKEKARTKGGADDGSRD